MRKKISTIPARIYVFYLSYKIRRLQNKIKRMEKLGYLSTSGVSVFEEIYRPKIDRMEILKCLLESIFSPYTFFKKDTRNHG